MAHFAKVENGVVTQVIVANDKEWCEENLGGTWIQTSYNTLRGVHLRGETPLRGNYAGIGFIYDQELDAFLPPKPYDSFVLDAERFDWVAPVPRPEDDKKYLWDEPTLSWVEIGA